MKAINIEKDFNQSSVIEVDEPIVNEGQTLLNVKAVGICQSDLGRVYNEAAYYYPITLGHEFAGLTSKGHRATVFPIIPCFECEECKKGNYAQCKRYSYYGSRQNGGMTERIAINNWNLMVNDNLDFDELAVIEPCAVAMRAVKNVPESANAILINGCGFISLVAAQILLSKGKIVYIRNRNKEKLKYACLNFPLIDYDEYKLDPIDCVLDFVSNSASVNYCIDCVKSHGTIIAIGNPVDNIDIEKGNYSKLLRKEISIKGIWNSKREDWHDIMQLIENKEVDVKTLITDSYNFENFKDAFNAIKTNQTECNKPIIKTIITF